MKINYFGTISIIIVFLLAIGVVIEAAGQNKLSDKVKGVCMVAPPRPFTGQPVQELPELGMSWVGLVPFGYTILGEPKVHYNSSRQWWGERTEGIIESIARARKANLKIFLKPHVYVPGSWPGGIDFKTEAEWQSWEEEYTDYIMHWARLAELHKVEALSIGTEFKISSTTRPDYWRELINKLKCEYSGLLTYCANWDEYNKIIFWDKLDCIGVDAYFPLSDNQTPSVSELTAAWETHADELKQISTQFNRDIVFTEYGYLSVDHAASKTWELESKVRSLNINQQAQANAIEALWTYFGDKSWWQGGFYWKWFPEMKGHEGYPDRDYTFQGKLGEETIKKLFTQ